MPDVKAKTWRRWTAEEDRAILAANRYGDLKQVARQLGREYGPLRQRASWLKREAVPHLFPKYRDM